MPHSRRRAPGALAALLLVSACDSLREATAIERQGRDRLPAVAMGPWLLDASSSAVTVAWVTERPVVGRVLYGPRAPERTAAEALPVSDHRVVLGELRPGTTYRYRIEGEPGAEGTFTTAPATASNDHFRIAVYGDNRTLNGDHALVARAVAAERAALALHTGDMAWNAGEAASWRIWFADGRELLASTPIVPTVGNDDLLDDGAAHARFFQRKGRPTYHSFDYGPLHVVVLDSFERPAGAAQPTPRGLSEGQRVWVEEDLRGVAKDAHVMVLVHRGPFAHPAKPRIGHGGSEPVLLALRGAARVHPIDAVFSGHEHFYERGELDGLRYFVVGGGGAPLDDPDPGVPGVRMARKALSYAVLDVRGCEITGQAKDIAGAVFDSFIVSTCGPRTAVAGLVSSGSGQEGSRKDRQRKRRRRGGVSR